eukprot:CAMPEP_0172723880 /NCGR_PEP_ID=MMETSP1074-20121228/84716_1 /TAXON_ID=2916 /ORGANISM="Ceratium fusus, Strain PA161109" /LENGTH=421 /DNA_ID=CAMNT_0013550203 /DNA_START=43 /DNA_END=1308 /DNA_ORIENTATION=-
MTKWLATRGNSHGMPVPGPCFDAASLQRALTPSTTMDTLPEAGHHCRTTYSSGSSDGNESCIPTLDERFMAKQEAVPVCAWQQDEFEMVRTLQPAPRNRGRVDLMRHVREGGGFVAVKRMANSWVRSGPREFLRHYPDSRERPWFDVGMVAHLHQKGYSYLCQPMGVYRDAENTYIVSSFAGEGDLFAWMDCELQPGHSRETMFRPVLKQVFDAVRWLHALGVAHRDISLENILLMREAEGSELHVKLIDFGAATLSRHCSGVCGKPSYIAPESYGSATYDAFAADTFSLGVVVFALSAGGYPWHSTKPGECQMFRYVAARGLRRYLLARKLGGQKGPPLAELLSESLVDLLEGLLVLQPCDRLALDTRHTDSQAVDGCSKKTASALDSAWWEPVLQKDTQTAPLLADSEQLSKLEGVHSS